MTWSVSQVIGPRPLSHLLHSVARPLTGAGLKSGLINRIGTRRCTTVAELQQEASQAATQHPTRPHDALLTQVRGGTTGDKATHKLTWVSSRSDEQRLVKHGRTPRHDRHVYKSDLRAAWPTRHGWRGWQVHRERARATHPHWRGVKVGYHRPADDPSEPSIGDRTTRVTGGPGQSYGGIGARPAMTPSSGRADNRASRVRHRTDRKSVV